MEERLHLTVEENEIIGGQFPGWGDTPGEYTDHFCLLYVLLVSQDEHICEFACQEAGKVVEGCINYIKKRERGE
jgi:hypothetical protein